MKRLIDELIKRLILLGKDSDAFYVYFLLSCVIQEYEKDDVDAPAFAYFSNDGLPVISFTSKLEDFLNNIKGLKKFESFFNLAKHEVLHILSLHPLRILEYAKKRNIPVTEEYCEFMNIIVDALVNRYLDSQFVKESHGVPPIEENLTLEEIADKYIKDNGNIGKALENLKKDLNIDSFDNQKDILKDFLNDINDNELNERIKNAIEHLKEIIEKAQKVAGDLPGEIVEIIKNWKVIEFTIENIDELFSYLNEIDRTYSILNHAYPDLPIYRPLQGSKILLILDTSGSIGKEEAEYFFGIIKNISSKHEVLVIEIDTVIQNEKPYKFSKNDDQKELVFKGRGGTDFKDLERLNQVLSPMDKTNISTVILLTDGHVYGIPEFNPLPQAKWIGITTDIIPEDLGWVKWLKLEKKEKRVIEGF